MCEWLWGVTAYAAAHGNVCYYSQRPTFSFAKPSRLRGMDMLHAACVLLMWVGRLLRSFTVNKQPCVQASLTHG